jgi:uncharacterized membrane protein YjfL (UPF0719 family)
MEEIASRAGPPLVLFLEVLLLSWVGRRAAELLAGARFDRELLSRDNPAAAVLAGGYLLGLFLALSGLLVKAGPVRLPRDLGLAAAHGGAAFVALLGSAALWRPVVQIDFRKDVLEARNLGAALVAAAAFVATGLVYRGAVAGQVEHPLVVAAFFALGESLLLVHFLVYEWTTPYDVYEEVSSRSNLAAALACTGAVLAAGIILGNAVEGEFVSWSVSTLDALLYAAPLLVLPLARRLGVEILLLGTGGLRREIAEERNPAAGLFEGAAYVGLALYAVHLMP